MPARRAPSARDAAAGGFLDRREILRRPIEAGDAAPCLRLGSDGKSGEKNRRCDNNGRQLTHVVLRLLNALLRRAV
jgi:hypothetical protein